MSADATFTPGYHFRGVCLKDCANRDKRCNDCIKLNGKETEFVSNSDPLEARRTDHTSARKKDRRRNKNQ